MITFPLIADVVPPIPPAASTASAPPSAAAAPAAVTLATGGRHMQFDAFYTDERNLSLPKGDHPAKSFYNRHTRFIATPPSYANARTNTFGNTFANPLNADPPDLTAVATVLAQEFSKLGAPQATQDHFREARPYFIFVPKKLKDTFDAQPAGNKPKARVALFFGVGPEINLFGLRHFFADSEDCVLVTIPGIEAGWAGIPKAWGIGITTAIIDALMLSGGLPSISYAVETIAGYSTGYRGVNLTVINKLVNLAGLKRLIYYDAFFNHDDYPQPPNTHPYHKKLTRWAVDDALAASASAEVWIYAYTHPGGVPRRDATAAAPRNKENPPTGPLDVLLKDHGAKVHFLDFEFKFQGKEAIDTSLEKVCMARLVQAGIDDYYERKDVGADILTLVNVLPARGSFCVNGRTGFSDLYAWIKAKPQSDALAGFPTNKAFGLIVKHKLLGASWTTSNAYEFRHRDFLQEIAKESLLP